MILDDLKDKLEYRSETSSHWVFRCPFCGDSKNISKGHLSVSKSSPVFRCVRCGEFGHISKLISISQAELNTFYTGHFSTNIKSYSKPMLDVNYEDFIQDYLKDRLNIDDVPNNLNILSYNAYDQFVKQNKLKHQFPKVVPFLTHNKNKIICRLVDSDSELRYYNYQVTQEPDYYTIFNNYKFCEFRKHKTVVIAEGIFDVLNTYINKLLDIPIGAVYIAALSKSFGSAAKFIRDLTFCGYPNIIMLADNDTQDDTYWQVKDLSFSSLMIYRNNCGKDFGEKQVEPKLSLSKESAFV
jgi:hypothetical protein